MRDTAAIASTVLKLATADGPVQLAEHITAFRRPGPLRLSATFLRWWSGADVPTADLESWARGVGLKFRQSFDFGGGWDLLAAGEHAEGLF